MNDDLTEDDFIGMDEPIYSGWVCKLSENKADAENNFKQILKNQEDAKQWKIYIDGGLNNLFEIHERLKKEIEFIEGLSYKEDGHTKRVLDLLQKILGEENGN